MKPRSRIRRSVKRASLGATALLAAVWIGSAWVRVTWLSPGAQSLVAVEQGAVVIGHDTAGDFRDLLEPGWHLERRPLRLSWWPVHSGPGQGLGGGSYWMVGLPVWMPVLALLGIIAGCWRLDVMARRRARANHCPNCGYDRHGIDPASLCPECGVAALISDTLNA